MSATESTTPPNHDLQLDRDHLPSQAAKVHETIRIDGEKELSRTISAMFWSALAAGLSMSFSMLAKGLLTSHLPGSDIGYLVASLGYSVGFLGSPGEFRGSSGDSLLNSSGMGRR